MIDNSFHFIPESCCMEPVFGIPYEMLWNVKTNTQESNGDFFQACKILNIDWFTFLTFLESEPMQNIFHDYFSRVCSKDFACFFPQNILVDIVLI